MKSFLPIELCTSTTSRRSKQEQTDELGTHAKSKHGSDGTVVDGRKRGGDSALQPNSEADSKCMDSTGKQSPAFHQVTTTRSTVGETKE